MNIIILTIIGIIEYIGIGLILKAWGNNTPQATQQVTPQAKEESVRVVNQTVVNQTVVNLNTYKQRKEEDLEDVEEYFRAKEELRIKFIERRKAWEEATVWNEDVAIKNYRKRFGIEEEEDQPDQGKRKSFSDGLFSLTAI